MRTPIGWVNYLEKHLMNRWMKMLPWDAYYEGDHQLSFATAKFREAFGSLFGALADNWMPLVVDSSAERLVVQGFRFGKQQEADEQAWDIWQANGLDADSDMLHTEAIKLGEAFWLVDPGLNPDGARRGSEEPPRITTEHPSQMIVAEAPGDHRHRLAALKKWLGDDEHAYATLYLPDQIHKFVSQNKLRSYSGGTVNWQRRTDDEGGRNPLGVVPVVPIRNSPSMMRGGASDIKPCRPIQDAVNKLLCDMLIGSEYQAFPQRVLLGVDIPKGEDGMPIRAAEMQSSQSRLWTFSNSDAKVAEFKPSDLDNYGKAIEKLVQHLTAISRTPPHYVAGTIVNASGDALKAAETGLVKKVRRKMSPFGEGHEEAMRLAFKVLGDEKKAKAFDAETIWADPESRSQAETVDAAVKLATIGVPQEALWERIGASPQEIDRWKQMQQSEDLLTSTQPTPPPPSNGEVPPEQAQQVIGAGEPT